MFQKREKTHQTTPTVRDTRNRRTQWGKKKNGTNTRAVNVSNEREKKNAHIFRLTKEKKNHKN